jgi:phage/conjugal plasmid C-4 type zinc finger TraR family protein
MSDDIDRAQERAEQFIEHALGERNRRAHPADEDLSDHPDCHVCGEPIPVARRAAIPGVKTCMDCQCELEQAMKRNGQAH